MVFKTRVSVFGFSRTSAMKQRMCLLNLVRNSQAARVSQQPVQTGEMVWKTSKGIADWCTEVQDSGAVITYLHAVKQSGGESISPAEKHREVIAGRNSKGNHQFCL